MHTESQQGLITKCHLAAIAEAVAHTFESRLTTSQDIPQATHNAIRSIGTGLRDDIHHGKCLAHVTRSAQGGKVCAR